MERINQTLKISADVKELEHVISFCESVLDSQSCPLKVITQICVSVEEIFVNIANYAYPQQTGECVLDMIVGASDGDEKNEMILHIRDNGKAFNPLLREDPDITLSVEERKIGGLGIWMVKQSMDEVDYRYEENWNILTITKRW